ncbi:hypothetical protein GA0115240_11728 [Streptomyces sp. DvalAA-14]|uniref:hypothetical protein n=1 Tax=unclassified Streptomyces TaxID=2593676 RepID=UPI00081B5E36|nr:MULTISPECIES: hypothetical protein [unclassified Streptomyces]MYS20194.1 hypothetical protein [Streptomyces sp. SID4948]SCD63036.1 hypothetical protein GA0115240_11728 [Streptomyces sp. DvalAA-14]
MGEFTGVVLGFPTVFYGGALVVVVGYWLGVLVGVADAHGPGAGHGHMGAGHHGGHTGQAGHGGHPGLLGAAGLGGVPVVAVLSLLTAFSWFLSLAASVALDGAGLDGRPRIAVDFLVLVAALFGAWPLTWTLVRPLRHLFPQERAPSREDFLGRICVIRTGSVTARFGQAEVAAPDGSTAILQVRLSEAAGEARDTGSSDGSGARSGPRSGPGPGAAALSAGSTALLYAYDTDGEFFWVAPFDAPAVT